MGPFLHVETINLRSEKYPETIAKPVFDTAVRSNHQMCSLKEPFLKISQNSQENTCVGASVLIKMQALSL